MKNIYAIRWNNNCICDYLGWFEYDEAKPDNEIKQYVKNKYNRNLIILTSDKKGNWYGTGHEMAQIERLWMTYFVKESEVK